MCRQWVYRKNIKITYQILVGPPPPVINSLLHRDGHQPSARGFSQYWGLKSCRPINTLCAPVSAPSRLLHLLLPAGGLAHGFPFSTACLHSQFLTHPLVPLFFFFSIFPPTHPLSPTPPIFPLISYSFLLERSRLTECLNWKQAVGRLSVWGWNGNSIWSASPGSLSFFSWQRYGLVCSGWVHMSEKTKCGNEQTTPRWLQTVRTWQEKMQNEACVL